MTQEKELAFETMKKDWEKKAFEANQQTFAIEFQEKVSSSE